VFPWFLIASACTSEPVYGEPWGTDPSAEDTALDGISEADLPFVAVRIEPGSFVMGAPSDEAGGQDDETPHSVTLTRPFALGVLPVTEGEWLEWTGSLPEEDSWGASYPARWLSWHDAAQTANMLSDNLGVTPCYDCSGDTDDPACSPVGSAYECGGIRLPTEAEWEYAARAGSTSAFTTGADLIAGTEESCDEDTALSDGSLLAELAWYCGNSGYWPQPAGDFAPNAWGLYDVHGASYEWVHDGYAPYAAQAVVDPEGPAGAEQVAHRGGSWGSEPRNLRLGRRSPADPTVRAHGSGVRLAMTLSSD